MDAPKPPPPPPSSPPPQRAAHVALAAFAVVLLGLLAYRGYGSRLAARPTEPVSSAAAVDLNRADRAELELLPGVGPKLAAAIETHRRDRGGFRSVDDLRSVPGVGPVVIDRLRPLVRVEPPAAALPVAAGDPELPLRARAQTPAPAAVTRKLQPGDPPVDVNRASADELQRIPFVGPVTASAIVGARPFRTVDELDRVRGIGAKTLEKLRPFVVVNP
jgi:competence protein ComEA